jgi:hypothetical protein
VAAQQAAAAAAAAAEEKRAAVGRPLRCVWWWWWWWCAAHLADAGRKLLVAPACSAGVRFSSARRPAARHLLGVSGPTVIFYTISPGVAPMYTTTHPAALSAARRPKRPQMQPGLESGRRHESPPYLASCRAISRSAIPPCGVCMARCARCADMSCAARLPTDTQVGWRRGRSGGGRSPRCLRWLRKWASISEFGVDSWRASCEPAEVYLWHALSQEGGAARSEVIKMKVFVISVLRLCDKDMR